MTREPCQKGTSFLPVVVGLKARPDPKKLVPERLWKYFDERIVVSGWYPERDYFALIEVLSKTIDPKTVGGDVWRFFAKYSVRGDLGGADVTGGEGPPARASTETSRRSPPASPKCSFGAS